MRIGILGTGVVGRTLGTALVGLGHDVRLGSRTPDNETAAAWSAAIGGAAGHGTYRDVAAWADLVVNATPGEVSVAVVASVAETLDGRVILDVANPLDFSAGFPPVLSVVNQDSLGEQVQRAAPGAKVVKALNTLTADLMLNPAGLPQPTDLFLAGDDAGAKAVVRDLLVSAGWQTDNIHDLGGIEAARGAEMWLPLWLRLMQSHGTASFNIHVVTAEPS